MRYQLGGWHDDAWRAPDPGDVPGSVEWRTRRDRGTQMHPRTAAAIGAALSLSAGLLAITAPFAEAVTGGTEIDLTVDTDIKSLGDASIVFSRFDSSTGTGVFESFVRLQASGTERGYNTDFEPLQFDELQSDNFTRSLPLSAVPIVTEPAEVAGSREFRLDINQTSANPYITLETAKIFVSTSPVLGSGEFDPTAKDFGGSAQLVWDMDDGDDRYVLLDYNRAPGSGNGDAVLYVDDADFAAAATAAGCLAEASCYVYLYSEFAGEYEADGAASLRQDAIADSAGPAAVDVASNDGFEEWSVRKAISNPTVVKSAAVSFDRTISWNIDKTVDQDAWNLFDGDDATSTFTISAEKTVTDGNWVVSGAITFLNAGSEDGRLTAVVDTISFGGSDIAIASVATDSCTLRDAEGAVLDPSFDIDANGQAGVIEAGETVECTYTYTFPSKPTYGALYTNTVEATFDPGGNADPIELTDVEEFQFLDPTTTIGTEQITVVDDLATPGDTSDDKPFLFIDTGSGAPYSVTYDCSDVTYDSNGHAQYVRTNTASFTEGTDDDATATVTVDCYLPAVTKDAATSLTRTYDWSIDKQVKVANSSAPEHLVQYPDYVDDIPSGGQGPLLLQEGQSVELGYGVDVVPTAGIDSDWAATGSITVTNPNPGRALTVESVSDSVFEGITATVDCGAVTFPYDVVSGSPLVCTYAVDLPDGSTRVNTATAAYTNTSFTVVDESVAAATAAGSPSDVSGEADVVFDADTVVTHVHECVDVTDDKAGTAGGGALGRVCVSEALKTAESDVVAGEGPEFEYSLTIGTALDDIALVCGPNDIDNTAAFESVDNTDDRNPDNDVRGSDTVTVDAELACDDGCTLTQGYWKTHANEANREGRTEPGPLYDDTWDTVGGPDMSFFDSGRSWIEIMWLSPGQAKKDAGLKQEYVILAHQWIAAVLNSDDVSTGYDTGNADWPAIADAIAAGEAYFDGSATLSRKQVIDLAGILAAFNEGDIGPGHCTE